MKQILEAPCRGCLDIKKSRSYAHCRISASILMLDGGARSPLLVATACTESWSSSKTRLNTDLTVAVGSKPELPPSREAFQSRNGVTWTSD